MALNLLKYFLLQHVAYFIDALFTNIQKNILRIRHYAMNVDSDVRVNIVCLCTEHSQ